MQRARGDAGLAPTIDRRAKTLAGRSARKDILAGVGLREDVEPIVVTAETATPQDELAKHLRETKIAEARRFLGVQGTRISVPEEEVITAESDPAFTLSKGGVEVARREAGKRRVNTGPSTEITTATGAEQDELARHLRETQAGKAREFLAKQPVRRPLPPSETIFTGTWSDKDEEYLARMTEENERRAMMREAEQRANENRTALEFSRADLSAESLRRAEIITSAMARAELAEKEAKKKTG